MRAVRREGQMVKGEERRVKRLNVKVLVKLAAIALVVLAALALGRDATLAHGSGWGRLTTKSTFGNEQVRDPATTLFAFEPIDGCGDDCCCRSGVECGLSSGCSGHGPAPGGAVAPGTTGLTGPLLSSNRMITGFTPAMAGVSRPPDEPPPRVLMPPSLSRRARAA